MNTETTRTAAEHSTNLVLNRAQRRALQRYIRRKQKLQLRHINAVQRKRNEKMQRIIPSMKFQEPV